MIKTIFLALSATLLLIAVGCTADVTELTEPTNPNPNQSEEAPLVGQTSEALTVCGWPDGTNCRANYGSGYTNSCCAARPTCGSRLGSQAAGPQPWNYTVPYTSFCF